MRFVLLLIFVSMLMFGDSFSQPLSGNYSIDNTPLSSANFSSINAAVNALISKGVSGPVVFTIKTNIYQEKISIPEINGASAINRITFQSFSGNPKDVTIVSSGGGTFNDHHTLQLNGADFIDLKNISIQNLNSSFASAIHITKKANYNSIVNCNLLVDSADIYYATRVCLLISGKSTSPFNLLAYEISGSYNLISNNRISGGYWGVALVSGDKKNKLRNNVIHSSYHGIYAYENEELELSSNILKISTNSNPLNFTGLSLQSCPNIIVNKNKIIGNQKLESYSGYSGSWSENLFQSTTALSTFVSSNNVNSSMTFNTFKGNFNVGIENADSFNFSKNYVDGFIDIDVGSNLSISGNLIKNSSANPAFAIGNLFSVNVFNENIDINNNMIITGNTGVSLGISITGRYNRNFNVFHNSVLNLSNNITEKSASFSANVSAPIENLKVLNNIFSHQKNGYTFFISDVANGFEFDNNLFFTKGNILGNYNHTVYPKLSDLQRETNLSLNSIFGNPGFVSLGDLHVLSSLADGRGKILNAVKFDFDIEKRNADNPDIGADEFTINPKLDIAIYNLEPLISLPGSIFPEINLVNKGINSLKDSVIYLSYSVNGGGVWTNPEQYVITGLEKQYALEHYVFKTPWMVNQIGSYNICVSIWKPRLYQDANKINDTLCGNICIALKGGVYSIGTGTADFPNIKSAVDFLKSAKCGIQGSFVFNIKPGTYNEFVKIPVINGSSAINTITFQSASGIASDVIIKSNSENTGKDKFTFALLGTDYVILKNLTIENTAKDSSFAVYLNDFANYVQVINCILKTDTSALNKHVITLYSKGVSNSNFEGNTIVGGNWGIYLEGDYRYKDFNTQIKNNKIFKSALHGMEIDYTEGVKVLNNEIKLSDLGAGYSDYGIYSYVNTNSVFDGNKIQNTRTDGVYSFLCKNQLFINNALSGFKPATIDAYGLYFDYCTEVQLYNNSINYNVTLSNNGFFPTYCIYINEFVFNGGKSLSNYKFINNVFSNSGGGYSFSLAHLTTIGYSNNNNLFSSGSKLGVYEGIDVANLNEWKTVSKQDSNSLSIIPEFLSEIDLHTFNINFDKKGKLLKEVSTDFDGNPRDLLSPDIGADEFILDPFDLAIVGAEPQVAFLGKNEIKVKLRNIGLNSLKDSLVKLSYSVDAGLTWTSPEVLKIKGLASTYTTEEFTFAELWDIQKIGNFYIKIKLSQGISKDVDRLNDTFSVADVCIKLHEGNYSVGNQNSDFPSLNGLSQLLSNLKCGIDGPVIFTIEPGIYEEQVVIPLVNGVSSNNTITFTSRNNNAAEVLLIPGKDSLIVPFTLQLNSAQFVTIKNLSLTNNSNDFASVINISSGSNNIEISNCTIVMQEPKSIFTQLTGILIADGTDMFLPANAKEINVNNNTISGGNYGLRFNNWFGVNNLGNAIINNTITNAYDAGISIEQGSEIKIMGNRIELGNTFDKPKGILITNLSNSFEISKNFILGNFESAITINTNNTFGTGLIINNMISGGFGSTIGNGITLLEGNNIKVYNNSVLLNKSTLDQSSCFYSDLGINLQIKNNIFYNSSKGYAVNVLDTSIVKSSDYNDFYSPGNNLANWSNTKHLTLSSLKTASGKDKNSINVDPTFFNEMDLHTFSMDLNGKGIALTEVLDDYDGQKRNTVSPEIGADEFTLGTDIGVIGFEDLPASLAINESIPIKIKVSNYGSMPVTNFDMVLNINDSVFISDSFSGNLNFGESLIHTFSKEFSANKIGKYSLKAYTKLSEDIVLSNDSLLKELLITKVGFNEITPSDFDFCVYPNPNNGSFRLSTNCENSHVQIFDIFGKLVFQDFNYYSSKTIETDLPVGIYFVTLISRQSFSTKIIVQ